MNIALINSLIYLGTSTLLLFIGYWFKTMISDRIDLLEHKVDSKVSSEELQIRLQDNLVPLKERVKELKDSVDKLNEFLIKSSSRM